MSSCLFLLSKVNSKDALYILPIYFSVIYLTLKTYLDIEIKDLKKTIYLSVLATALWILIGVFFQNQFIKFNLFFNHYYKYNFNSHYTFIDQKKNLNPKLMAFVIFPFLLNSFHENDQYVESIQFIKNKNIKRNPQETYIIADDYSYIGYPLWNRALKI